MAVVGSRDFDDYEIMLAVLAVFDVTAIISGGARGADSLAERYARENNIAIEVYPADWDRYGKSAGFIRNQKIANLADAAVAFWDGKSRGTRHTMGLFWKAGKPLTVIRTDMLGEAN